MRKLFLTKNINRIIFGGTLLIPNLKPIHLTDTLHLGNKYIISQTNQNYLLSLLKENNGQFKLIKEYKTVYLRITLYP